MRIVILLSCLFSIQVTAQTFVELCGNHETNGTLVDFKRHNTDILATGFFTNICDKSTNYVAQWDGSQWEPSSIELPYAGHFMHQIGEDMYFATYVSGPDSNWLWKYDGNTVEKFGEGVFLTGATEFSNLPNIYDVIEYQGDIIICGEFDRVGNKNISGIARWNGSQWSTMGDLSGNIPNSPPFRFPHQMMVHNNELYVVGNFKDAGSQEVNGVAKWNGTEWSTVGDGFSSTVYSIALFNDEIYAGGDFTFSGVNEVLCIAKLENEEWISPGFGFRPASFNDYAFVHTMKVIDDEFWILGGLKEIFYDDGSMELCGGALSFDGINIKTYNEGVSNNDIEAIIKDDQGEILIGGGVFGNGYSGILDLTIDNQTIVLNEKAIVYPNPVSSSLRIDAYQDILKYEILDVSGKTLYASPFQGDPIDFENRAAGIYFLKFRTSSGWQTEKVTKL